MDRQFYISFIIISHMKHAYRVKNVNLHYANLITRILRLHMRDISQRDMIHLTNLFHELSNLGWVNNSVGDPPVWTPNHKYPINSWIKDPNTKVIQYTDHNSKKSIFEPEPTQDTRTSSQPQSYPFMPNFTYDSDYQTSFDPYLAPLQTSSMQDYFEYIAQSMYHINLNQQALLVWKIGNIISKRIGSINMEIGWITRVIWTLTWSQAMLTWR
jgi:hypothetical protein